MPRIPAQTSFLVAVLAAIWAATPGRAAEPPATLTEIFRQDAPFLIERVPFERGAFERVAARFSEGVFLRRMDLTFTSQTYRGMVCEHRAVLFLPEGEIPARARGTAAIALGPNHVEPESADLDWVESVVVGMGVPVLVVLDGLPFRELGARNAGELMSMGDAEFLRGGDPREGGYYAMARVFVAAATVLEHLPETRALRMIASGSSKGGMAALLACAGDPRIVGAYPTAFNAGNFPEFTKLKGRRWGWDVKPKETGPAGESARAMLAMLDTAAGRYYRQLFDPYLFADLLAEKFVMRAVGTNDHLSHVLSDRVYSDQLSGRNALLRVANYGHGHQTPQHAAGWRFAVAAALLEQPVPEFELTVKVREGRVEAWAAIGNAPDVVSLTLFTATDPSGDYRKAAWESRAVAPPVGGELAKIAELDLPATGTLALYAELRAAGKHTEAIVSSRIEEVGQPREIPFE